MVTNVYHAWKRLKNTKWSVQLLPKKQQSLTFQLIVSETSESSCSVALMTASRVIRWPICFNLTWPSKWVSLSDFAINLTRISRKLRKMFSRMSYAMILCLLIGFSNSQQPNSRRTLTKSTDTQAKQNFVVNNNCGLAQSDRETLALIKSTVDDIAAKTGKGMSGESLIFSNFFKLSEVSRQNTTLKV